MSSVFRPACCHAAMANRDDGKTSEVLRNYFANNLSNQQERVIARLPQKQSANSLRLMVSSEVYLRTVTRPRIHLPSWNLLRTWSGGYDRACASPQSQLASSSHCQATSSDHYQTQAGRLRHHCHSPCKAVLYRDVAG